MTTYNTKNPVPSADARDRYDNSQVFDELMNGPAPRTPDRLGILRQSWAGIEAEFVGSQATRAAAFQAFLDAMGWSSLGAYAAGISIISHTQTVDYQGQPYQLKPSVPASLDAPYVTTGNWATEGVNFKLVGDNSLRQDLSSKADLGVGAAMLGRSIQTVKAVAELRLLSSASPSKSAFALGHTLPMVGGGHYDLDPSDSTSADNDATVIVAEDGGRWKLQFSTDLHISQSGAIEGQDFTDKLNILSEAMYKRGGGTVHVSGSYSLGAGETGVKMYPSVHIKGSGQGAGTRITSTFTGAAFETFIPEGYASTFCIGAKVTGFTLIGKVVGGSRTGIAFSLRNCFHCDISENEIANFNVGIAWNRGSTTSVTEEAYFNKVYQNLFKPCTIGQYFNGAANRNTFDTNSYADNMVAYNFSDAANHSETNTFINENIEGCHEWAEWGANIYSQTWIGICIENPTSNGFVCLVKDPGRQVFVNLSLIPLGNSAAISKYDLVTGVTSMVIGSAASSGSERLGVSINEPLKLYDVVAYFSHNASQVFSGTVNAGTATTITIPLSTAMTNDRVDAYALRSLQGCTLQAFAQDGAVQVIISNGLSSNVTISNVEISVILKRVG